MKLIETAQAQVIGNAPTFTEIGGKILNFMLQVLGIFVIIGLVVTAVLYFTAGGNQDRINLAKKSLFYCLVGGFVGLGAMVLINQMRSILQ